MCEFCGCEGIRSSERPAHESNARGKPIGVGIVAVAAEPKARRIATAYSDADTRLTPERATVKDVTSAGA